MCHHADAPKPQPMLCYARQQPWLGVAIIENCKEPSCGLLRDRPCDLPQSPQTMGACCCFGLPVSFFHHGRHHLSRSICNELFPQFVKFVRFSGVSIGIKPTSIWQYSQCNNVCSHPVTPNYLRGAAGARIERRNLYEHSHPKTYL